MSTTSGITRAITALLSTTLLSGCSAEVAAARHAAAIKHGASQKCYGVARGGYNDCKTDVHICAGWAYRDADPNAFVYLPTGTCDRISGGRIDGESASATKVP